MTEPSTGSGTGSGTAAKFIFGRVLISTPANQRNCLNLDISTPANQRNCLNLDISTPANQINCLNLDISSPANQNCFPNLFYLYPHVLVVGRALLATGSCECTMLQL